MAFPQNKAVPMKNTRALRLPQQLAEKRRRLNGSAPGGVSARHSPLSNAFPRNADQ